MRDYKMAFGIGLASSVLWFFVLRHLSLSHEGELVAALVAIPFLFTAAVALAHRWFHGHVFHKIAKFLIVGVLNTGIDFFIFDTLIVSTGLDAGGSIALFKSFSFLCALFNSYEMNRLWTFDGEAAKSRTRREFVSFAVVTLVGFLVNVGITFFIVDAMKPLFGLSQIRWDNVAAVAATVLSLGWNFIGYKLFVFTSKGRSSDITSPNVI